MPTLHAAFLIELPSLGSRLLVVVGDTARITVFQVFLISDDWFLHVGTTEEVSEQYEVGGVHDERDLYVLVRHMTLIAGLLHLVRPDVDSSAHNHLGELGRGDEHGDIAGHLKLEGLEGVVAVHYAVYEVVHAHEPAGGGDVVGVGVPGIEQHGHVVVPVKEDEGLLPEHNEHCVSKLRDFAEREHPVPEAAHTVVQEAWSGDADRVVKSVVFEHIEELW